MFLHEECKNQAEYDALYKPYGTPRKNTTPTGSPRNNSPRDNNKKQDPPKAKAKAFALKGDYSLFCRHGLDCDKRPEGGTGECSRIHCSKAEADRHVSDWKEKVGSAAKPKPRRRGSPRNKGSPDA